MKQIIDHVKCKVIGRLNEYALPNHLQKSEMTINNKISKIEAIDIYQYDLWIEYHRIVNAKTSSALEQAKGELINDFNMYCYSGILEELNEVRWMLLRGAVKDADKKINELIQKLYTI